MIVMEPFFYEFWLIFCIKYSLTQNMGVLFAYKNRVGNVVKEGFSATL